jgi:hypothetical protein
VMLDIVEGRRPPKPNFSNTRGYTQELWEMTTHCWEGEPAERPTVDCVSESLRIAAELWKPEHGRVSAQPTRDARSQTLSTAEGSDSSTLSDPDDEHLPIDAFFSRNPFQSPAAETPIPAGHLSPLTPPPPDSTTLKAVHKIPANLSKILLKRTPTASKKDETEKAPIRPTSITPNKVDAIRFPRVSSEVGTRTRFPPLFTRAVVR